MRSWRTLAVAAALAFAAWVVVGIYRAGGDIPPPTGTPQTTLNVGHAEGRRLQKPSWSLDYDSIRTSPDNTTATLENVHDGELYKNGKPFMKLHAKHVVVNTISNDFTATGPVELVENDGRHRRRFVSDSAIYQGIQQTLVLNHPARIESDGAVLDVATATINFRSGDTKLGRITGTY